MTILVACTYQNVVYQVGAVNYHKDSAPAPCRANRCTLITPPTATLSGETVTVTDGTADFVEIGKGCDYDMMGKYKVENKASEDTESDAICFLNLSFNSEYISP